MVESLTPIERKVYNYLLDFLAEKTYQPSIREIGKRFKIKSTKTVSDLLGSLARKGFIERDPARSRGVRLVGFNVAGGTVPVPYYGKVHAGEPSVLPEHREGFITMDRRFVPSEVSYFLKVKGDSMIGRGLFDGDFVLVDPSVDPRVDDIIAARLGEEATVKSFHPKPDGVVVLEPANPAERTIVVKPADDFAVLGVIRGVFRPMHDAGISREPLEN
jgi:repressor LexA